MSRARPRRPSSSSAPPPPPTIDPGPSRRRTLLLAVAALIILGALATWRQASERGDLAGAGTAASPPNVLLVTLDTTRADRLGSYGYAAAATPNLDRLAREGVRFERALSPVPLTLPAHVSLMTGLEPFHHGVRNNGHFVLPADVPTLAEALAARGYDTAAFVSSFVLDRQFGLARGFAHYDDGLDEAAPGPFVSLELERRGDRTVNAARAWLSDPARQRHPRPYFLWVHLYDAHEPYAPPSPFRERFPENPYDGEIAFQDTVIGPLLDAAGYGTATPPLVVVAGDHGEGLGDHGESAHGLFVYDAVLRVPLIMAWPGRLDARTVAAPVRLIDLAPTVLDLVGASIKGADGQSIGARLHGGAEGDEAPAAYAETFFPRFFMQWAPLRALHAGRWKLIDAPEPELYDLQADPAELDNLAAREPARLATMRRALEGVAGAGRGREAATPLSDDARRRLSSLGYIAAASPMRAEPDGELPDPKRMLPLYERLLRGNRLLATGDANRAARLARGVLAADPRNAFAQLLLGRASLAVGRPQDAIDALRAYAAAVPGSADAHHWLALAHLRLGDRTQALVEEEAALAIDPRHTAALGLKAGLIFSTGRRDEGLKVLRDAVERDPANVALRLELADLLTDGGRYADAEAAFRSVIAVRPGDARAHVGLGLALGAQGRAEEALATFEAAISADPANDEAHFARGEVREQMGRLLEARQDYAFVARSSERRDLRDMAARRLAALEGR